jgi:hypothetical protein
MSGSFVRRFAVRTLKVLLWVGALLLLAVVVRGYFAFRDRVPGYVLDLTLPTAVAGPVQPLKAGFGRVNISPDVSNPKKPVWVAGFSQNRAATAVHDDLWATGCVLDDGRSRVGIVVLDAIGFFHDDVVRVRRSLPPDLKIDYAIICSTHNHSTPDLMGLWGSSIFKTGVDAEYLAKVRAACVSALSMAASNLQPARVAFHEIKLDPANLVTDTRKPIVYDSDVRVMHFVKPGTGETIGSLVNWGNHPETVWSRNTEVTSDFCGFLRDALASGVEVEGKKAAQGVGGIHMFVNGAVGGLMTTSPSVTVRDPFLDREFKEPTHEKSRAVGWRVASVVLPRLCDTNAVFVNTLPLSVRAKTVTLRLENKGYLLAGFLGLLDRGYTGWRKLRTEVAMVTLGEASIACIPGEIYPEIVNGGVEKAPGGDFGIEPVEVPSIRELMPGKVKFVFGLANDEVGYIVPRSEWDQKPPHIYGANHAPYGEVNSVGSGTGPAIHGAIKELCLELGGATR